MTHDSTLELKYEDFEIGEKVLVKITDVKSDKHAEIWREGVVTDKGHIHPSSSVERFKPYPKFKVKYIHTYYRVTKEKRDGLVYVGCEGEFYDKENESLFFTKGSIKKHVNP